MGIGSCRNRWCRQPLERLTGDPHPLQGDGCDDESSGELQVQGNVDMLNEECGMARVSWGKRADAARDRAE